MDQVIIKEYIPELSVDDIIGVSEENVRQTKRQSGLRELEDSLEETGLIQPVIVIEKGGKYEILVGQRRYLALRELGRTTIPALVMAPLSSRNKTIVSYAENIYRRALPYDDTVRACNELYNSYKGTKKERINKISKALGIKPNTIAEYLAQSLVPPEVRKLVSEGKLSKKLANRITGANFPNTKKIISIANKTARLTSEEKERVEQYEAKHPNASEEDVLEYAKNPPPEVELIIHIGYEVKERLDKLSNKKRTSVKNLVKDAIDRYLDEEGE